jgi:hypothetical protein
MLTLAAAGGYIALLDRIIPGDLDEATVLRMEFIEGTRDASHVFFMTPSEMLALYQENDIEVKQKETLAVTEPYEEYLAQTNVVQADRAAISQFIYGNMVAPDADMDHTTGLFPHLVDDVVTITHHLALIGGINPVEKPVAKKE